MQETYGTITFGFVALQMTDKLPLDIGRKVNLAKQLLGVVFTKDPLTSIVIGHDFLFGAFLAHHTQPCLFTTGFLHFFIMCLNHTVIIILQNQTRLLLPLLV